MNNKCPIAPYVTVSVASGAALAHPIFPTGKVHQLSHIHVCDFAIAGGPKLNRLL